MKLIQYKNDTGGGHKKELKANLSRVYTILAAISHVNFHFEPCKKVDE